ncbi:MAG: hypothetical protein J7K35_07220 [Syntrophobacterales bacterium]|nr:hypothetical protein [Syntrophobacterales bacterium]
MNALEQYTSELNSNVFFREFSFAKNKFSPKPKEELEFADHVVWLDDLMLVFQCKERNIFESNSENEKKWFNNKVVREATKQIRNTLGYLADYREIYLTNDRNHVFNLATAKLNSINKIVLYTAHDSLPLNCRNKKYHNSSSVGFIHIFNVEDYIGICETLVTPTEFHHYLSYREELINQWEKETVDILEDALLGHFLYGDLSVEPSSESNKYLMALKDERAEWDFTNIGRIFADRMTVARNPQDYYKIVSELAKFKRTDLKLFKERFELAKDKAMKDEFTIPFRMTIPDRVGFVFVPITQDMIDKRTQYLSNLTLAHKYDQKLSKCVGLSISPDSAEFFYVEWCFIESPWEYDEEIEKMLKESFPFRPVREHYVPTYTFDKADRNN